VYAIEADTLNQGIPLPKFYGPFNSPLSKFLGHFINIGSFIYDIICILLRLDLLDFEVKNLYAFLVELNHVTYPVLRQITPWSQVLLNKPQAAHPLKNSQTFYVPIPCSKENANGFYPKADESSPHIYPISLRSTLIRQGYIKGQSTQQRSETQ
jgi:hypothetical protein